MLTPNLLNVIFDQSDYQTLALIYSLNKCRTKYANMCSVLNHYDVFDDKYVINIDMVCENDLPKILKYFVHCGYDVNTMHDIAVIELMKNAGNGHQQTAKYLINIGFDIHHDNDAILKHGIESANLDTVECAVRLGANIHKLDKGFLMYHLSKSGSKELAEYLYKIVDDGMACTIDDVLWLCVGLQERINVNQFFNGYVVVPTQ